VKTPDFGQFISLDEKIPVFRVINTVKLFLLQFLIVMPKQNGKG